MSTILYSLGRWSYRHPWRVLIAWLLLLGIAGGSAALFMKGTDNSFSIPGTESQAGIQQLGRSFPQASGTSAQIVVVTADGASVDDEPYASAIEDAVSSLEDLDGVLAVTDPFNEMVTGLVSDDGDAAIIRMQFEGQATSVSPETKTELKAIGSDLEEALPEGSQVLVGGDLFSQSLPTISLIEAVGVLIALFVLIVTFRSFRLAWFPLASALIGVALSVSLIFVATAFASISATTPLLAIMLGLAVGIDYALFITARHQDQVRTGMAAEESAARANGTAGSAVVFAGVTVLIALIGLSFANIPFLTTMGIAASVAVAIAVLIAVTLTPAFLGFAKGRVIGWKRREPRAPERCRGPSSERSETKRPNRRSTRSGCRAQARAPGLRDRLGQRSDEASDHHHGRRGRRPRHPRDPGREPAAGAAERGHAAHLERGPPGVRRDVGALRSRLQRPAHHDRHDRHVDRSAGPDGRSGRRDREDPGRQGGRTRDPERHGRHRHHPDRARDRTG